MAVGGVLTLVGVLLAVGLYARLTGGRADLLERVRHAPAPGAPEGGAAVPDVAPDPVADPLPESLRDRSGGRVTTGRL
jgi:hypothetical protein